MALSFSDWLTSPSTILSRSMHFKNNCVFLNEGWFGQSTGVPVWFEGTEENVKCEHLPAWFGGEATGIFLTSTYMLSKRQELTVHGAHRHYSDISLLWTARWACSDVITRACLPTFSPERPVRSASPQYPNNEARRDSI